MRLLLPVLLTLSALHATTLEKLSLEEMVAKSTAIVRGTVRFSHVRQHGAIYYTHYTLQVAERLKGPEAKTMDIVLPGGQIGRTQQTFSGIPQLPADSEMALFLWTSKSGLTHIIGLGQGILQVSKDASGQMILSREPIREGIINPKTGRAAVDAGLRMTMNELRHKVQAAGSVQ